MSKRKVMLLLAAAIVAVLTVVVARSLLGPQEATQTQAPIQTTEVLAASRNLPTGTILKEIDMKWIPWSAEADLSKMYVKGKTEMSSLTGDVLREGVQSGEPILQGRVVQTGEHGFLAAVLSPGTRAISVTLTPNTGVAGFIFPGDRVDVLLTHTFTFKDGQDNVERRVSETVLSDVRVLALDQRSDNQITDPKIAQLATLEVTPAQAQKLALAAEMVAGQNSNVRGSLSLILRSLAKQQSSDPANPETASAPQIEENVKPATTWDSDVSPAFPTFNEHRVQVMRGKATSNNVFDGTIIENAQ
jgi:pilus assembly protein CpaB